MTAVNARQRRKAKRKDPFTPEVVRAIQAGPLQDYEDWMNRYTHWRKHHPLARALGLHKDRNHG